MSNKKIILFSVLVGILIISAGLWLINRNFGSSYSSDNTINDKTLSNDFNDLLNGGQGEDNASGVAIGDDNRLKYASYLSEQDKEVIRNSPEYFSLLRHQNICQSTSNAQNQANCFKNVELKQIILSGNSDLCSQTGFSEECYINIAWANNDPAVCAKIKDAQKSNNCADVINDTLAASNQDLSFCDKIKEQSLADE